MGKRTVVLNDGGFKSAFVTDLAIKEYGKDNVRLLFIDHGQKAAPRQWGAVQKIADYYGIPFARLDQGMCVAGLFELTTHIFTALSYAHSLHFSQVYYGACRAGSRSFNYELTHTHLRNLQLMVQAARHENEKKGDGYPLPEAPAMELNVIQVVQLAKKYNTPLQLTWNCETAGLVRTPFGVAELDSHPSAVKDSLTPHPCGICDKCVEWEVAKKGLIRTAFSKYDATATSMRSRL